MGHDVGLGKSATEWSGGRRAPGTGPRGIRRRESPLELENRFTVPASVDTAWAVLLDVPRIAPCMPGAALTEVDGDRFTGTVKVKLGPINLTYGGTATIVSRDDAAHVAVIEGKGKETRGTGTAKAVITCRLVGRGDETDVAVDTDLQITGKPAQFGRGVLADVSGKLVDQFAACLAEEIRADATAGRSTAAAATSAAGAGGDAVAEAPQAPSGGPDGATDAPPVSPLTALAEHAAVSQSASPGRPPRQAEPVDLLGVAGAPVLKRLAPVAGVALLLVVLVRALRRR